MNSIENNLFKAVLVGVLAVGCFATINDKTNIQKPNNHIASVIVEKNEVPMQQVIIIGKRLPKNDILVAKR